MTVLASRGAGAGPPIPRQPAGERGAGAREDARADRDRDSAAAGAVKGFAATSPPVTRAGAGTDLTVPLLLVVFVLLAGGATWRLLRRAPLRRARARP